MPSRLSINAGLRGGAIALGVICLTVMAWRLIDGTGHDFSYFFPRMLDSYLFAKANGLSLQEYTASYCAGIFVFANPQSIALSLPQALLFTVDPITAVRVSFVLFSVLGGLGMYLSARKLNLDPNAALIAAAAYCFSGYLITRMAVGHVAFHTFALAPLIAWVAMLAVHSLAKGRRLAGGAWVAGAALLLAFTMYSGGAALLPQMGAIVGSMTLIYALRQGRVPAAFAVLTLAAVLGALVAAPKVEAGMSVLAQFPKDYYASPGFTIGGLLRFFGEGLFFSPSVPALNEALVDRAFRVGWHEFYVGLTPFVLLVMAAPLFRAEGRRRLVSDISGNRGVVATGLACALAAAALNIHIPGWNALLQQVPLLGQVSTQFRWLVILSPLLALLAGRAASYWALPDTARLALAAGLVVAMTAFQLAVLPGAMKDDPAYDPGDALQAWALIHDRDARPPQVTQIGIRLKRDDAGALQAQWSPRMDHAFLSGMSNALCYEPIFGYRLERYPFGSLRPGGIGPPRPDGTLNLKNPACYVYPEANGCAPGDHFREEQTQLVADLLARKPVTLPASTRRQAAEIIGLAGMAFALAIIAAALAAAAVPRLRRRRRA